MNRQNVRRYANLNKNLDLQLAKKIVQAMAKELDVDLVELLSESRYRPVCNARHAAAWLMRSKTKLSLSEIALVLRRTDHTTVINSLAVVDRHLVAYWPHLAKVCNSLKIK